MQYSIPDNPRGRHTEDNKKIDETVFEEKKPSSSDLTAESEPPLDQNEAGNQSSHPLDPVNKEDPAPPEKKDDFEDSKSLSKASEDGDLEMPNSDLDPNLKIGEEPSSEMTASSPESPSIPDSTPPDNSEGSQDLKGQQLFQQLTNIPAKKSKKVPIALAYMELKEEQKLEKEKVIEFRDLIIKARDSIGDVRKTNQEYKEQNDQLRAMLDAANQKIIELENQVVSVDPPIEPLDLSLHVPKVEADALEKKIEFLQDHKKELQSSKNALTQALAELENQIKSDSIEMKKCKDHHAQDSLHFSEKISQLEDRSRELQARCNALSSTNEDLESKYQKSLKTNPDKDLKSTPKELKILQQKVSNLLDLNKEKTSINNTLKSAFDELESRYEVLLSAEEKQDTKDSDFIEIEDMKNNLNDLSDRLREEIAIKNTVIAALESLEEDSISNPQESLGIPPEAESLEFLRDRNRELQAVLNTLQSAYQDLEEKYQKLGS